VHKALGEAPNLQAFLSLGGIIVVGVITKRISMSKYVLQAGGGACISGEMPCTTRLVGEISPQTPNPKREAATAAYALSPP